MTEELGMRVQDMFKTVYDAVDLKYLRPLKVSLSQEKSVSIGS